MASLSSHLIGTVVARRFQLREAVASGGMGMVFRAHDLSQDQTVALKVLTAQQSDAILRFQREVQILHELHHPAIVRYISHGAMATGQLYLVMEWLEGEDLAHRMARQALSVEESVDLGAAVASALEAAHASGVVHRDIKPSNLVLLDREISSVKVVDFGIAQLAGSLAVTQAGAVVGTPEYMSPEQLRGERDLDLRTDLFSLGCVLFECLNGSHPFNAPSPTAILSKILLEPAPDLATLQPALPRALCALINAMLEKDRNLRPGRAEEVLEVLRGIQITERLNLGLAATVEVPRRLHLTTKEQRLLSLVMVVPDSASLAEDATLAAAPESGWLKTLAALAEPFGGRCDRLPDGSVLILLSGQPTASDQARQAARLALQVRAHCEEALRQQNSPSPPRKLQLAVATRRGDIEDGVLDRGSVDRVLGMLARAEQRGADASSDADLESRSRDSGAIPIWLDEMTRGLLGEQFQTSSADGLSLLLAEHQAAEPLRWVLGRRTPFFGRDAEMRLLSSVLNHSISEPCARIVLVTAEAGAGKTRLHQEFLERARREHDNLSLWMGSGHPLRVGSPFALLAQSLRHALMLPEGAATAPQYEMLRQCITERLAGAAAPTPVADQERIIEFIGELLGIQPEGPAGSISPALQAARVAPMLMGDQIRRAVLELLAAECASRPLLWVLEDLHWGDRPTVWLIDAAMRQLAERPFCVLALARPSVREVFPDLWRTQPMQEVRLRALPRKASEQIARAVLGSSQPLDAILEVLEKARGNAFFLEEMLRAAAAGQLAQIPPTVLAMVQSRIEQLDAQARRALRAASVFGPVFWRRGVLHLLGKSGRDPDEQELFEQLVQCELIRANSESRFADEEEYSFAHALVQDAAYAMMTDSDRSLGHRLAAEFLEAAGEEDALVLADHWQRGGQSIHAVSWFRKAAWQALEGNDLEAVLLRAEQAMACGATGLELGELHAVQAEAHQWRGTYREVLRHAHAAMELLPPRSQRWFQVAGALAIAAARLLDNPQLRSLCEKLRQLAEAGEASDAFIIAAVRTALQAYIAGDYLRANALLDALAPLMQVETSPRSPAAAAMICLLRANRAGYAWQLDLCPRYYEESAALFEQIGDQRNAASQNFDAAVAYLDIGDFGRTEQLTREIIAIADRLNLRRLSTACYRVLGAALYYVGRHDESREMNRRSLEQAEAAGDRRTGGACQIIMALLEVAGGDWRRAEELAEAAQTSLVDLPSIRARALAVLGEIQLAQGRPEEALRNAAAAYAILESLGRLESREAVVRLSYAEALRAAGAAAQALEILRAGRERLLAQAACIADPAARRGFLSLPDPARLLRRCGELGI